MDVRALYALAMEHAAAGSSQPADADLGPHAAAAGSAQPVEELDADPEAALGPPPEPHAGRHKGGRSNIKTRVRFSRICRPKSFRRIAVQSKIFNASGSARTWDHLLPEAPARAMRPLQDTAHGARAPSNHCRRSRAKAHGSARRPSSSARQALHRATRLCALCAATQACRLPTPAAVILWSPTSSWRPRTPSCGSARPRAGAASWTSTSRTVCSMKRSFSWGGLRSRTEAAVRPCGLWPDHVQAQ